MKEKWRKYWYLILAIITSIFLFIFKLFPPLTEYIYSNGLYRLISAISSRISNLIPFSLFDVFAAIVLLYALGILIYYSLIKRNFKKLLLSIVQIISVLFFLFYWSWGFNYYRVDPFKRHEMIEPEFHIEYITEALDTIIPALNSNYAAEMSLSEEEVDQIIEKTYKKLHQEFSLNYPNGKRRPKKMLFSGIYTKSSIYGYFGPFFNEIHLNPNLLAKQYPTVLAHEKAHQFGITSEAECNFFGYIICKKSGNQELMYCADQKIVLKFLRYLKINSPELYENYLERIRPEVMQDFRDIKEHWAQLIHQNAAKMSSKAYNVYLKSNGIKKGIDDYDMVTELLIAWEHKGKQSPITNN